MALPLAASTIRLRETPDLRVCPPGEMPPMSEAYKTATYEAAIFVHPDMLDATLLSAQVAGLHAERPARFNYNPKTGGYERVT